MMMIDPVDGDDDEAQDIGKKVGHIFVKEAGVGSCGAFNSKTMMVMRIDITPSLNASIRLVLMRWKCNTGGLTRKSVADLAQRHVASA